MKKASLIFIFLLAGLSMGFSNSGKVSNILGHIKIVESSQFDLQMLAKTPNTWNEFQQATKGIFNSRADAATFYNQLKTSNFKVYAYVDDAAAASIETSQLGLPGKNLYLTPNGTMSPLQARIELALPQYNTATSLFELDFSALNSSQIQMMRRVTGSVYNQGGGGFEILYNGTVDLSSITRIR